MIASVVGLPRSSGGDGVDGTNPSDGVNPATEGFIFLTEVFDPHNHADRWHVWVCTGCERKVEVRPFETMLWCQRCETEGWNDRARG